MGWTKREFIEHAFDSIGLANYVFDLPPEAMDRALSRLDAMIAGWNANGVRINYPLSSTPGSSNLDDDSGVPDFANEAIYLNLAPRLATAFGKPVPPDLTRQAREAYGNLVNQTALPTPERVFPSTMPRGQGQKPWRNYQNPFLWATQEPLLAGSDGEIEFD